MKERLELGLLVEDLLDGKASERVAKPHSVLTSVEGEKSQEVQVLVLRTKGRTFALTVHRLLSFPSGERKEAADQYCTESSFSGSKK